MYLGGFGAPWVTEGATKKKEKGKGKKREKGGKEREKERRGDNKEKRYIKRFTSTWREEGHSSALQVGAPEEKRYWAPNCHGGGEGEGEILQLCSRAPKLMIH